MRELKARGNILAPAEWLECGLSLMYGQADPETRRADMALLIGDRRESQWREPIASPEPHTTHDRFDDTLWGIALAVGIGGVCWLAFGVALLWLIW